MKIIAPPGVRTDMPPASAEPFWLMSSNVRWRMGIPETVGNFARILTPSGDPLTIDLQDDIPQAYADETSIFVGTGDSVIAYNWSTGVVTRLNAPEAGGSGRWWFLSDADDLICGRANLVGKTYVIRRGAPPVILEVPNAPAGGVGAGVIGGILLKAGTQSVGIDPAAMVVRWSARRTDIPLEPPFGFERWIPDDQSASGEYRLDKGKRIVGAGETSLGFAVWTDTTMYLLEPRADVYVFSLRPVVQRGLMANRSWVEADGRIWWFDNTLTLNVMDGGRPRQIPCPIYSTSLALLGSGSLQSVNMWSDLEFGEVCLSFRDMFGVRREVVYSYAEGAWYQFNLSRLSVTDQSSARPAIGITADGGLYLYDLRERITGTLLDPPSGFSVNAQGAADATPLDVPHATIPEPFSFYLGTNLISAGNLATESQRGRNITVSHTYANAAEATAAGRGDLTLEVRSFGTMASDEVPVIDTSSDRIGSFRRHCRFGGKLVQFILHARDIRTLIRFGEIDVEADLSGER